MDFPCGSSSGQCEIGMEDRVDGHGMMGRLTDRDRELIGQAIQGIAMNDIGIIQDVVLELGEFKERPDPSVLYEGISGLMSKYGTLELGQIDIAEVMMDLMEVMKENKSSCPMV